MNYQKRITIDPKIMVGKPVITGTRVPVELLLKMLAQGMSEKEILKGYPRLTKTDLRAAVWYARSLVENQRSHPMLMS